MNDSLHRTVLRLGLAAALVLGAAPATRAGGTAPGTTVKPPGSTRGGDGVGGIEKGAASGPGAPGSPNGGPPGGQTPGATEADPSAVWTDAGGNLPGEHVPSLEGSGGDGAGQLVSLSLREAAAAAPAVLVVGTSASLQPFKGGTLVPSPDLVLAGLLTDATGSLQLQASLPAQLPPGLHLWVQLWVPDAGAPQGLSATNALRLALP